MLVDRATSLALCIAASLVAGTVPALAQKQGMALQMALPEHEALVQGDPGLLHRAVVNLLSNAIKYGKNGEWANSGMMQVQYHGIKSNELNHRPSTRSDC